jgi:cyanophycinase
MKRHGSLIAFLVCLILAFPASAQPRIDPAGIDGVFLLAGSHDVAPAAFEKFIELAGGAKAKIVILKLGNAKSKPGDDLAAAVKKTGADEPRMTTHEDAKKALADATGVWILIDERDAPRLPKITAPVGAACQQVLKRGGVIGSSDRIIINVASLGLLPDALAGLRTSQLVAKKKLMRIGCNIDGDSALLVKGRTMSVVGPGTIRFFVGLREIAIRGNQREDLTALRRAAVDYAQDFPPKTPEPPFIEKGTLVIVGGGGSPAGLNQKFVEFAGGEGKACIVIFPTAAEDPLPKRETVAAAFMKAGAKKATVLYGKTRSEVESKEFLDTLKEATGLWFDGGRQWRFVDCYENTKALPLMFDVLKRGGVIGGTSAGATIQGDYLCRGGVFNNFDIRYEGYERGLGFLKGVAIDQHFTQRKRQSEMTKLMKTYPQYLGIGLDEATAIVVKGQIAEVIGKGKAHFYDANRKVPEGQPDFEALAAGARYDLKERQVVAAPK